MRSSTPGQARHTTGSASTSVLTSSQTYSTGSPFPTPTTPTRKRLFNYTSPALSPHRYIGDLDDPTHDAYSISPVTSESQRLLLSPRKATRTIAKGPFKVLDAPDLADDYYLNLVDWSATNVLGVGLASCVYLWSANTSRVTKLCDLSENPTRPLDPLRSTPDAVTSLNWTHRVSVDLDDEILLKTCSLCLDSCRSPGRFRPHILITNHCLVVALFPFLFDSYFIQGNTIAIGTDKGEVQIWDAERCKKIRTMTGHAARVGSLAWSSSGIL